MTTPTHRPRRSSRCASWSRATRCCSPSRFSERPRTQRSRNISTRRRCRSCSPPPARRSSQILKIKDAGADLFFSATTPKQAAQAIKKIAELAWKPVHILDINATSVGAVMKPAGLEASKGVISVNYGKDPLDPTWKDDAGMKKYFEFMAKYYPDGDKDSSFNSYGYSTSQLMIHVLQKCGDNLTRENVMKVATSLKNVVIDLSLPGIVANTTPDDYRVNKQLQMMRLNGVS